MLDEGMVKIVEEKHYRLVPGDRITADDLQTYAQLMKSSPSPLAPVHQLISDSRHKMPSPRGRLRGEIAASCLHLSCYRPFYVLPGDCLDLPGSKLGISLYGSGNGQSAPFPWG